ncbi:MAG: Hsp33 family molecular chaperone HslO [Aestuariivirga sp.]
MTGQGRIASDDLVLAFDVKPLGVRGRLVRLGAVVDSIVRLHDYPAPVSALLAEAVALTAMLGASLKFEGKFIFQTKTGGPVDMIVADYAAPGGIRGYARFDTAKISALGSNATQAQLLGKGHLAMTVDQGLDMERYQGIVPLEGESIAHAIEAYMLNSEQLQTRLWLAADADVAAGLLLQKLSSVGGTMPNPETDEDAWPRLTALAATISSDELLRLPPQEQTRKLFRQEQVAASSQQPRFECTCSRKRIGRMLLSLGRDEVQAILAELGSVTVSCDFCNARHEFDAVDIGELFATGVNAGSAVNPPQ